MARDLCDMPICEKKLQFQICDPNGYRTRVGIHPNAHDPRRWVRNGLMKHQRQVDMAFEEAEAAFDLTAIVAKHQGLHTKIVAVSDYLHKHTNRLGSRPLSEAVNPVFLCPYFNIFDQSQVGDNSGAHLWIHDERLFDRKKGLEKPIAQLDKIPEGIIPCMDTKGIFANAIYVCHEGHRISEQFHLYGILKPIQDQRLFSKGLTHSVDIRAVRYSAHSHMWGEVGVGFAGVASFHEQ